MLHFVRVSEGPKYRYRIRGSVCPILKKPHLELEGGCLLLGGVVPVEEPYVPVICLIMIRRP